MKPSFNELLVTAGANQLQLDEEMKQDKLTKLPALMIKSRDALERQYVDPAGNICYEL